MALFSRRFCLLCLAGMVLVSCFLIGACGYQFRATGEPVGIELESLAIPLVSSPSSDRGFEAVFTRIVREEFISRGRVPLVASENAQAVLQGRITDIRTYPVSFKSQEQTVGGTVTTYSVTRSRELRVTLDMQLVYRESGKVVWHEKDMEERATFAMDTDPLTTQYNQQKALERIALRMAQRIYLKTMERF